MASDIEVTASITTDDLSVGDVYDAMRLGDDDISKKSPITPGLREVTAVISEDSITLRVSGHDGEWSKTSQEALLAAAQDIEGVDADSIEVVSGGYEQSTDESDEADEADESDEAEEAEAEAEVEIETDVGEIEGVGPERAEQLRDAGIETVDDVIEAGADALVEAGISEGVAENIVERA